MKKNKAIGVVVAIALFLGLLTYTTAVGFGPTGTGAAKNITLGLDLSGGVSITYEVVGDETSVCRRYERHDLQAAAAC